jgi:hypothetical protein
MVDPNQTPERGDWVCPCSGCQKAVANERKLLIEILELKKVEYLIYRGSSFDSNGNLLWAKEDALSYAEGIDVAINLIKDRMPKPKVKK